MTNFSLSGTSTWFNSNYSCKALFIISLDNINFTVMESQQCSSKLIFEETVFLTHILEKTCAVCFYYKNLQGIFIQWIQISTVTIRLYNNAQKYKETRTEQTKLAKCDVKASPVCTCQQSPGHRWSSDHLDRQNDQRHLSSIKGQWKTEQKEQSDEPWLLQDFIILWVFV